MADKPLTFSIIVIAWNQRALLQRLVGQLMEQEFDPARYEIVVVDDGSTDGSREWLRSLADPRIKLVFGDANRGRSAARNAGIRAATGDIVVMVDGDHTVPPNLLAVLDERHAGERCVIVVRSVFVDHPDFRALNDYLGGSGATKLPMNTRLPGRYFLTRSCSVPRDLLVAVGMFDEHFKAWGGEDLDLGVRLEESGVPIYGEPRATTIHHHLRPLNDLLAQMRVYGRDGIPVLLARHPQLFFELNLDKAFAHPGDMRAGSARNAVVRLLLLAPIYECVRAFANSFRRFRLPRAVFDYLHFRQYAYGYMDYLNSRERKS